MTKLKKLILKSIKEIENHPQNPSNFENCEICASLDGERKCRKHSILKSFINSDLKKAKKRKLVFKKNKDVKLIFFEGLVQIKCLIKFEEKIVLIGKKLNAFTYFIDDKIIIKLIEFISI